MIGFGANSTPFPTVYSWQVKNRGNSWVQREVLKGKVKYSMKKRISIKLFTKVPRVWHKDLFVWLEGDHQTLLHAQDL